MLEDTIKEFCSDTKLTEQLTKTGDDYNYQLKFWNIGGYDRWDSDPSSRRYAAFERKGYVGFTFSSVTAFELKKIKKWIKDQEDKNIKLSNSDWYWNSDCDGYNDNCYAIWFLDGGRREAFRKFLETFEERPFNINLDFKEEVIKSILKEIQNKTKVNYWVIETFEDWGESYVFQTTDEKTAKQVLRFAKELTAPEIMILE